MIQDDGQILLAAVPAEGFYISSSFGIDLNPDFGEGANPRKSPLSGMGDDWMVRVDVASAFTQGDGTPMAQFHLLASSAGAGVAVHSGSNVISIGVQAPAQRLLAVPETPPTQLAVNGIRAGDLPAGAHFFIRPNPWTKHMGKNVSGAAVDVQALRYLGVGIVVPNYYIPGALAVGNTQYFDGGIISAHIVKTADVMQDPVNFTFPSAVLHKG